MGGKNENRVRHTELVLYSSSTAFVMKKADEVEGSPPPPILVFA
jgi:hypothetical protein